MERLTFLGFGPGLKQLILIQLITVGSPHQIAKPTRPRGVCSKLHAVVNSPGCVNHHAIPPLGADCFKGAE